MADHAQNLIGAALPIKGIANLVLVWLRKRKVGLFSGDYVTWSVVSTIVTSLFE